MNKSQRIYLNTGDTGNQNQDKFIKVKLEQDVETIEFMSLNISTTDAYQNFNADYGVLVGRVIANNGIGIPNAKISIFIPLTDEDANNSDIYSIYPYKTPRDKNNEGKRYNLLPRVSQKNSNTGLVTPLQAFGSFPIKEEVVGNEPFLDVYKKYYKYTALTNYAGDYMIFGVPVGTQTVHMSVDITDIGEYSMTPASMVTNLGYSPNFFTNNNTRIKPSNDLGDLPHIETQEISVDIIPFWGNTENFEIGITRQDFRIRAQIGSTFTIFGSTFTDGSNAIWANNFDSDLTDTPPPNPPLPSIRQLYRIDGNTDYDITTKQIGEIKHTVYYYPNNIMDEDIDTADPINDIKILDPTQYTIHKREGDFVFIINCNRKKMITNEQGVHVEVPDSFDGGIYSEFKGFITIEIPTENAALDIGHEKIFNQPVSALRFKLKIPQHAAPAQSFSKTDDDYTNNWRRQYFTFKKDNIYSVARFHGLVSNNNLSGQGGNDNQIIDESTQFLAPDVINKLNLDPNWNTGIIMTKNDTENTYQFPTNGTNNTGSIPEFGSNWLNFSIYFPQFGYFKSPHAGFFQTHSSTNFTVNFRENTTCPVPYCDNDQDIAAGEVNTKWFARSDLHWTDFITVDKEDIQAIYDKITEKGFDSVKLADNGITLKGDYRNGNTPPSWGGVECPFKGGRINGDSDKTTKDSKIYFYKGYAEANCIDYLYELGVL